MPTEHVILLNTQGVPSGTLEKYAAHTADTPLHLAFSCWLFNAKGQLLVTRRALNKKAWPVCGPTRYADIRNWVKAMKRR